MKMTKGQFAALVRKVKETPQSLVDDQVPEDLCSDLHYVLVLAYHFPEDVLASLEHPANEKDYFW